jgi:hypothetical protein
MWNDRLMLCSSSSAARRVLAQDRTVKLGPVGRASARRRSLAATTECDEATSFETWPVPAGRQKPSPHGSLTCR